MPVHTNTIGEFRFLEIQGSPYLRQQQKEPIERGGLDGTGARKLGRRGKPFQLLTINYEESYETTKAKMDQYKALTDEDPVELVRQSVSEGTFLVWEVVERNRYAILNAIGGIQDDEENLVDHQVCHEVVWTLSG